jgi:uncharacterized membrane protein YukC
MQKGREIPTGLAIVIIVAVLIAVAVFFWWKTLPTSGEMQVSNEEFLRRYEQMLRSSQPYNPPLVPQRR